MAAERKDPYLGCRFLVEIDNLLVGGFSEVSGLVVEVETEDYQEGGVNNYVHKLPKGIKYPNLVLKRGVTDSDDLWKWHQNVVNGKIEKKSGNIILQDSEGNVKWTWSVEDVHPIKWTGPDFKADNSAIAIESLELVHKGIRKG
jgi:phage tail-like protein